MRRSTLAFVVVVALACQQSPAPQPQPTPRNLTGVLGAASYEIDVPGKWNGTLFLYSHGYVAPGGRNAAQSAPGFARTWLLDHHFAAAGSAYSTTGWAVEDALKDQMALLDFFTRNVSKPTRVIAWGHSLGGLITAGLIQLHPDRFAAAMPMCGVLSGAIATWNVELDSSYAFKTLLAPQSQLELVHVTDGFAALDLAQKILTAAQQTQQGQARLALVAALADLPGWFSPAQPEPAANDYTSQASAQWLWISPSGFGYAFPGRLELEQRAGGNPSWNVGVDYGTLLAASVDRAEVESLYAKAGLNLQQDIRTLNAGTRIKADPAAAAYLDRNLSLHRRRDDRRVAGFAQAARLGTVGRLGSSAGGAERGRARARLGQPALRHPVRSVLRPLHAGRIPAPVLQGLGRTGLESSGGFAAGRLRRRGRRLSRVRDRRTPQ